MRMIISILAFCAFVAGAQELMRASDLSIPRANVLTVKNEKKNITTNSTTIGRRTAFTVATNSITVARDFPLMTDILQRSQAKRLEEKKLEEKPKLIGKELDNGRK